MANVTVRLLQGIGSATAGHAAGEVISVSEAKAANWVAAGIAVYTTADGVVDDAELAAAIAGLGGGGGGTPAEGSVTAQQLEGGSDATAGQVPSRGLEAAAATPNVLVVEGGNSNGAITYTAVTPGADNVGLQVAHDGNNSADRPLGIVVVPGTGVFVELAVAGGVYVSTAAQVIAAFNAHPGASALMTASNGPGSSGTGPAAPAALTPLTGGTDAVVATDSLVWVDNVPNPVVIKDEAGVVRVRVGYIDQGGFSLPVVQVFDATGALKASVGQGQLLVGAVSGNNLSYSAGTGNLLLTGGDYVLVPRPAADGSDEGKTLKVVGGVPAWVA
jgi:hypothetical protein